MRSFVNELLFVEFSGHRVACPLICRHMAEFFVITQRFAVICLIFTAKVRTATFFTIESITAHQHAQLKEVINTTGFFERLVDAFARARNS